MAPFDGREAADPPSGSPLPGSLVRQSTKPKTGHRRSPAANGKSQTRNHPSQIVNRQSSIHRTERQREAARRSIVKAHKAWVQLLRDPNFRLPAETLLKIWQGLVNAVRRNLTDCSAHYASRFREGIFAISLVRSLAAAGEVLADYCR